MGIFSILGDGMAAIGNGMAAIGRGMGSIFGPKSNPEEDAMDRLTGEQERADWISSHKTYTRTDAQDITITENGVRKHVRMENGKVVSSENVEDPEAFVKEHVAKMDKTFSDMSDNMDQTFKDMSKNMDATFKNMFRDRS